MMRWIVIVLVLAALGIGSAYLLAGRAAGPTIVIHQPQKFIGLAGTLDVSVEAPKGQLTAMTLSLEQDGHLFRLFTLGPATDATIQQETPERIRVTLPVGKQRVPELKAGALRLVATASRPVFFGIRTVQTQVTRELQAQFEPPRLAVLSTHHYINFGGSEFVVYRVSPSDVESGVIVGDITYPGYPASGAGVSADPSTKVAFFALLYDQELDTPIELYARDAAGNSARASIEHRVFPRNFVRSRFELDDRFLRRVVPAILATSPELKISAASDEDLLQAFLEINGKLRRLNADKVAAVAAKTSSTRFWQGPFQALGNAQVESRFADHRTYFYKGAEVDQQVHLGFDLAATSAVPILAANTGVVLYEGDLGIYGNTVILDHGLGVQSLYAHLSAFDVKAGDRVEKGQPIGRSGMTGLAGGDHLHFTMLVQGHPVNAADWWDPHWIEDRVTRKLDDLTAAPATSAR